MDPTELDGYDHNLTLSNEKSTWEDPFTQINFLI
jgi:hypothetical protein